MSGVHERDRSPTYFAPVDIAADLMDAISQNGGLKMAKKAAVNKTEEEIRGEINGYELLLRDTDYISHKHADGALTDEEYEAIRTQREGWRQAIRDLREMLPDEAE